jgi:hypothetical protein
MSIALAVLQPASPRRRSRTRRVLIEAGSAILGVVLLIWSLFLIYNMFLIALDPEEGEIEFAGNLWAPEPSLKGHCQLSGPRTPFSGPARLERGSTIGEQRSTPTQAAAPPTRGAYHGRLS